jgi:glucose/arabinose dehydrogenase/lysophospholipase L1-like esterase
LWIGGTLGAIAVGVGLWLYFRDTNAPPPLVSVNTGDRVIILGNTFAERMQYFGHFETLLHSRFPDHELVVRNLGYSGDEITNLTRPQNFEKHGHSLADEKPNVVIACFGMNESFAGPAGLSQFEVNLDRYVTDVTKAPPDRTAPRLVLVSPIAHENLDRPGLTDGKEHNENLRLYTEAMRKVAAQRGIPFVDLFEPSQKLMAESPTKLTINGIHLSDAGYEKIAAILDEKLFGPRPRGGSGDHERLRAEVNEKNRLFWYDYRATNGNFIYGAHYNSFGAKNFPEEFKKLRAMTAARDRRIWSIARGEAVPDSLDPHEGGDLSPIATSLKEPPRLLTPAEEATTFKLAAGFEINLFASEVEFPDLKKPVAMAFDGRGRLWVTTMPSYPMYLPGEPPNDKVLILEDTAGTGKADKATTFADGLYLPTGIALGDGGAYVGCQPNVLFLKDTTGTGKADRREMILHGFGNTDSHRAVNVFRWGPDGALYFDEGVYNYTQVETPYGPRRNFNGGIYRYEPRSEKLDVHVNYKLGNPWGHVWDRWGQDFIADAADGSNYYATPLSGRIDYPKKHAPTKEFLKQWRPTCGCAFVSSRNFPDEMQGDYLLNNTMNFQGILRYVMKEDGSGFTTSPAEPLLQSSDPNFRPVDLQFGPDGALYVCDWYNPIIGYIDTSLRDPNRDKTRGRIWRITYKGRPLVPRPAVVGASIPQLLELLKAPEDYTRGQARLELRSRDGKQVVAELEKWVAGQSEADRDFPHHLLEALWVCEHHGVVNESLLKRLLRSSEPRARAAATRVLCNWRDRVPGSLEVLRVQANDEHPRVRLEAVRALSFYEGEPARTIAKSVRVDEKDYYLKYAQDETLATLDERLKR